MRVLLLSGYDAASHRRWRQSLASELSDIDFTQRALPPRHFKWRVRGNGLAFSHLDREVLAEPYDALVVTSMVDLATLRGFTPALARVPTLAYFHENQFAYPTSRGQHPSVEPQITSVYTALAADRIAFNSLFNRDTFLAGARRLFKRLPDQVPPGLVESMEAKSEILPVPLEADCFTPEPRPPRLELLWNHRWEYDKNPDLLLEALRRLYERYEWRLPFTLHVVGQQFRHRPEAFDTLYELLKDAGALGHWGFVPERADYERLLRSCHGVVSTADHDFQGLSVLEAVAGGCLPIVPARQAYPDWFGIDACYPVTGDLQRDGESLAGELHTLVQRHGQGALPAPPDIRFLHWDAWRERYRAALTGATNPPGISVS